VFHHHTPGVVKEDYPHPNGDENADERRNEGEGIRGVKNENLSISDERSRAKDLSL
jgi:hypothetical protein